MKKSQLFQYAIVWHPTEKQSKDDSLKSKVLVDPKMILAESQSSALMAASMEIPTEYKDQLDQIEILMRPF
jgi:hypothetical protein